MTVIEKQVEQLREHLVSAEGATQLKRMNYRLSDAIREGASVSGQSYDWADAEGNMCALSAAVVASKARGYMS